MRYPNPRAFFHAPSPRAAATTPPQGNLPPHSGACFHPSGLSPTPLWLILAHSGSFWPPHPRAISRPTLVHASTPQGFLRPHSGSFWLILATPPQGNLPPHSGACFPSSGLSPTPLWLILAHSGSFWPPHPRAISRPTLGHASTSPSRAFSHPTLGHSPAPPQ